MPGRHHSSPRPCRTGGDPAVSVPAEGALKAGLSRRAEGVANARRELARPAQGDLTDYRIDPEGSEENQKAAAGQRALSGSAHLPVSSVQPNPHVRTPRAFERQLRPLPREAKPSEVRIHQSVGEHCHDILVLGRLGSRGVRDREAEERAGRERRSREIPQASDPLFVQAHLLDRR